MPGRAAATVPVESGLALTPVEAGAFFVNGVVPTMQGTRNKLSAPYQAYRAKDGHVIVGAGNQKLWEKFLQIYCGKA
jgi:crotonobetainyl-CoA:carnitine CoA-transferase CaiB-like acyl-CoA transferase